MIVHDPMSFFSCQSIIPSDDYLTDIEIYETIIIDAINELSSSSAAGPDAIPSLLLINCAAELDLSKAFDKVDHGILLHKLKDLGITGKLGIWFFQFLPNRTHYRFVVWA